MQVGKHNVSGGYAMQVGLVASLAAVGVLAGVDMYNGTHDSGVDRARDRIGAFARQLGSTALRSDSAQEIFVDGIDHGGPLLKVYDKKCTDSDGGQSDMRIAVRYGAKHLLRWTTSADEVDYVLMQRLNAPRGANYLLTLTKTDQGWTAQADLPNSTTRNIYDPSVPTTNPNGIPIKYANRTLLSAEQTISLIDRAQAIETAALISTDCGTL